MTEHTPKLPDASCSNNYFVYAGDDLNSTNWFSRSYLTAEYERGKKEAEESLKARGWCPPPFPPRRVDPRYVTIDRDTANEMLKYLISFLGDPKKYAVVLWKALGHTDPPPV